MEKILKMNYINSIVIKRIIMQKNIVSLLIVLSVLFFGCTNKNNETYNRNETLYIGGFQWGEVSSFNPLADWPVSWPVTSGVNLVYEPLFLYNILTGELEPLLGDNYAFTDSTLTVTLDKFAKWNDGKKVTVDDIAYTFLLHKRYETINHDIWEFIRSIAIDREDSKVIFTLNQLNKNPLALKDILSSVYILPMHIFAPMEKRGIKEIKSKSSSEYKTKVLEYILSNKFLDRTVSSGPYKIYSYDSTQIVLKRDDKYWGNAIYHNGELPRPKYIIHPIMENNSDYNKALTEGNLDVSAVYCPLVWNLKKYGVGTWESDEPYYIPGSIPSLVVNQLAQKDSTENINGKKKVTTKAPLLDAKFRRVMAMAINYEMIRKRAIQGYAPPLSPGFIINSGIEQMLYDSTSANKYGVFNKADYNNLEVRQSKAKKELSALGYTLIRDRNNPAGRLVTPNHKVLATLKITTPKGWDDWEKTVKIVVQNLRNIGIPAVANYVDEDKYWEMLGNGDFDLIMNTPQADQVPSLPWSRFYAVFSIDNYKPRGEYAVANEGRYINKEADSLLKIVPTLISDSSLEAGYKKLNEIFMKEMPLIPVMYRPSIYYQFSTKHWNNFPTIDNPYTSPSCLSVGASISGLWYIESNKK